MDIRLEVDKEIEKAETAYGNFNSTHEAYAVLKEEIDELWDIVKQNTERTYGTPEWKTKALVPELVQIAAIAIRTANELQNNKIKFV
jgi:RNAse (barnase) inhibitor barstar